MFSKINMMSIGKVLGCLLISVISANHCPLNELMPLLPGKSSNHIRNQNEIQIRVFSQAGQNNLVLGKMSKLKMQAASR